MKNFVKRMCEEHAELVVRIQKLHGFVYSNASDKTSKVEFANMCIQLAAMKKYEEALRARLENHGVFFENGIYLERVGCILPHNKPENPSKDENGPDTEPEHGE